MVQTAEGVGMGRCIVLASSSPRRRELLAKMGLFFRIEPANIDEGVRLEESPYNLVRRLATSKAVVVGTRHPECLIIGADTVVVYQGHIFGKPTSRENAREMLSRLSGQRHQVFTALAVWEPKQGLGRVQVDRVEIEFVSFSEDDVDQYLHTDEPWDKAGAYAIQGYAQRWVKNIAGDVQTVIGLPTRLLTGMLSRSNKGRQQ